MLYQSVVLVVVWHHIPKHVIPDMSDWFMVDTAPERCIRFDPPLKPAFLLQPSKSQAEISKLGKDNYAPWATIRC